MLNQEQVIVASYDSTTGALKTSMSAPETAFVTLGNHTVAKNSNWTSADIDVSTRSEIIITAKAVYNADAINGAATEILASLDSTNFDTDAYAIFGPDFDAGTTARKTRRADVRGLKMIRLRGVNYDTTQSCDIDIAYTLLTS